MIGPIVCLSAKSAVAGGVSLKNLVEIAGLVLPLLSGTLWTVVLPCYAIVCVMREHTNGGD